jgi:hypothetical protein
LFVNDISATLDERGGLIVEKKRRLLNIFQSFPLPLELVRNIESFQATLFSRSRTPTCFGDMRARRAAARQAQELQDAQQEKESANPLWRKSGLLSVRSSQRKKDGQFAWRKRLCMVTHSCEFLCLTGMALGKAKLGGKMDSEEIPKPRKRGGGVRGVSLSHVSVAREQDDEDRGRFGFQFCDALDTQLLVVAAKSREERRVWLGAIDAGPDLRLFALASLLAVCWLTQILYRFCSNGAGAAAAGAAAWSQCRWNRFTILEGGETECVRASRRRFGIRRRRQEQWDCAWEGGRGYCAPWPVGESAGCS